MNKETLEEQVMGEIEKVIMICEHQTGEKIDVEELSEDEEDCDFIAESQLHMQMLGVTNHLMFSNSQRLL